MMSFDLRAERSGRVDVDLIINDRACVGALNLPAALVDFANRKGLAGTILRSDPVDVLGKVADLIESIPDRKLKVTLRSTGREKDLHFDEVLLGRGENNVVTDGSE